jgi:glycerophosphoryl diester phosphodiesterase
MKSAVMVGIMMTFSAMLQAFEVQGHRGARALRPENTLPAFEAAIDAGADTIELDVLATKEGELVIHHDYFVNQELCAYLDGSPIDKARLIRDLTLDEIKQLDAGRKTNPSFPKQVSIPGTQVPTLQELFDFIQNSTHPHAKTIRVNLELKRDPRFPEWTLSPRELAEKIVGKVRENRFSDRVYYSSFDPAVLIEIRNVDPKAKIGFLYDAESLDEVKKLDLPVSAEEFLINYAWALGAQIISPDHELLKQAEDVHALKEKGFRVVPWTVNDPKRWKELIEMGVDGLICDNPLEPVQYLHK